MNVYILPFLGPPSPKDLDGPSVGVLKRNQYFKNHEIYMVLTSFHSWDLPNVPPGSPDLFPCRWCNINLMDGFWWRPFEASKGLVRWRWLPCFFWEGKAT